MRRVGLIGAVLLASSLCAGCGGGNGQYMTEDRLDNGLVIILPGIEGESEFNRNIRRGLLAARVDRAIMIHNWGLPVPLVKQVDVIGNRLAGAEVAKIVVGYQRSHPGRPVHIIGHSGGGGVAVFAAEEMPADRKVDGLVLLSPSISAGYDLRKAMANCRDGIVNFYNPADTGLLGIGTTIVGNVDGIRGPSAGLTGFQKSYADLRQVRVQSGRADPHSAATNVGYVRRHVAPYVLAGRGVAGATGHAAGAGTGETARLLTPKIVCDSITGSCRLVGFEPRGAASHLAPR